MKILLIKAPCFYHVHLSSVIEIFKSVSFRWAASFFIWSSSILKSQLCGAVLGLWNVTPLLSAHHPFLFFISAVVSLKMKGISEAWNRFTHFLFLPRLTNPAKACPHFHISGIFYPPAHSPQSPNPHVSFLIALKFATYISSFARNIVPNYVFMEAIKRRKQAS